MIILSLNCHGVVENVSRKTNGEDKAIKIKKRRVFMTFQKLMNPEILFPNIFITELQHV